MSSGTERDWRSSLRITFAFVLSAMVAITALGITSVSYISARNSTFTIAATALGQVADLTEERVYAFLRPPRLVNELARRELEAQVLDPADRRGLEGHFFSTLQVHPSLSMMAWADTEGGFLMVKRAATGAIDTKHITFEADGDTAATDGEAPALRRVVWWDRRAPDASLRSAPTREEVPDDTYDPRVRPWFTGARDEGGLFWTDVYVFFTDMTPGVTASTAFVQDGVFQGVVAVDISLAEFSRFLAGLEVTENGEAYLIDDQGRLIGTPRPDDMVIEREQEGQTKLVLRTAAESTAPAMRALGRSEAFNEAVETGGSEGRTFFFPSDRQRWVATISPIEVGDAQWMIAVLAPENDFLADLKRQNRNNVITALVLGGITILISLVLARWISSSLQLLVTESEKIQGLSFEDHVVPATPFREIYDVLDAFDGMKTGLRAFQRYLPLKLVRILLEEHVEPELGSELKEVTVYFSDVAGFATVSEQLEPQEMAQRLGYYLSELSHQIQLRQGTVVQYVGDEIMAFWNAPLPVEDHPVMACKAALECAERLSLMWKDEPDAPDFPTRFGLHTCEVAVGHFGSPDRMYYGAIGDGVNLTSRLEGINKVYGTTITISESTYERVADQFETRQLDLVRVKGKNKPVAIYELIAKKGHADAKILSARERYEAGLTLYQAQQWDEAIAMFDEAIARRPDDKAAMVMKGRCEANRASPPPADWDGVHTMTTK